MDKSAQGRIERLPDRFKGVKHLIVAVCEKYGERWAVPFVVSRQVLTAMIEEGDLNEQKFWERLEDKLANPPTSRKIHL
jgi:hypothetical protein